MTLSHYLYCLLKSFVWGSPVLQYTADYNYGIMPQGLSRKKNFTMTQQSLSPCNLTRDCDWQSVGRLEAFLLAELESLVGPATVIGSQWGG